jgi:hypothetical protein
MAFCTNCGAEIQSQFCPKCGKQVGAAAQPVPPPEPGLPPRTPITVPSAPEAPKKRGAAFWVLIGCLGLLVIGAIIVVGTGIFVRSKMRQAGVDVALMQTNPALAVAKMMAAVNPDIEVLGIDEERGIIRVRDKKTGKALTVNLEDAKNGKIVFMDDQNEKLEIRTDGAGKLPDWLPAYGGAEGAGNISFAAKEGQAGTYAFKTKDTPDEVATFYEDALKGANFEVQKSGQGGAISLMARDEAGKRTAQITIVGKEGESGVTIVFQAGK